jgi:hypothetical protein
MMTMTYAIAMAAATDAANRAMQRAGRTKWSRSDYSVAVDTFNELYPDWTWENALDTQGDDHE